MSFVLSHYLTIFQHKDVYGKVQQTKNFPYWNNNKTVLSRLVITNTSYRESLTITKYSKPDLLLCPECFFKCSKRT